jgi:hypothetical protein
MAEEAQRTENMSRDEYFDDQEGVQEKKELREEARRRVDEEWKRREEKAKEKGKGRLIIGSEKNLRLFASLAEA